MTKLLKYGTSKTDISKVQLKLAPWLVVVFGLAITAKAWHDTDALSQQELHSKFNLETKEVLNRINERMTAQEQVLLSTRSLFSASRSVDREGFHKFVRDMALGSNYPGIQGVGFSLIVPPEDKDRHIAAVRHEGFPDYAIRPQGERDLYTAIVYLEPFDWRNKRAFGYDMYSEPVRREAMSKARDTADSTISGKVKLLQETNEKVQPGFLMYVPVYKNGAPHDTLEQRRGNILGWTYSPFRMYDLMNGALGNFDPNLDIEIYDGASATADALMYDSGGTLAMHAFDSLIVSRSLLPVSGHDWMILIKARPSFESPQNRQKTQFIAIAGGVISLLLGFLTWILISGRERALTLARQMSHEAIESEARFRTMANSAPVLIWIAGTDKLCFWFNQVWLDFTGRSMEQEIGNGWAEGVHPDDFQRCLDYYVSHFDRREGFEMDYRLKRHDGEFRWIYDHGVTRFDDQGVFLGYIGSCVDITEQKEAEKALQSSEAFAHATIDAVCSHICVLDKAGNILAVNKTWRDFHDANSPETEKANYGIGQNYLAICDYSSGQFSDEAKPMSCGIRSVINGETNEFYHEYPCHTETQRRLSP